MLPSNGVAAMLKRLVGGTENCLTIGPPLARRKEIVTVAASVPAFGFATIPWPASFVDTDAGGEVILYTEPLFGNPGSIMDFVCWGTNPHFSRQGQAFATDKWSSPTACAPALTGGAIHRLASTDGVDPADYDTASPPSPMNCTP